jgi:pilus assembly protein CpaF
MTAMDGGERLDEGPAALNSALERPRTDDGVRPLDEIFPLRGDAGRGRLMRDTWRVFAAEMTGAVRAAFADGRSPPEIAYALGEIVHNFFRTRGVTLTSYELRRMVAELLARQDRSRRSPSDGPLVRFADEPRKTSWTGAETSAPPRAVSDAAFAAPASTLVTLTPRDDDVVELLAQVTTKVRAGLAADPFGLPRAVVVDAIAAALAGTPEAQRRPLARLALSELCGLGPLDRLWADRSIRSLFVNGTTTIHVERDGVVEPSPERFRDRAHLEEIVRRLVGRPASPAVTVDLRDGSEAVVLLAPAAPAGPVLALRRGEPGDATLERLVAGDRLSRPMADLLRIATRSRLNVLVVGPQGSGKTSLLAAMARDVGDARTVTLAHDRAFRWPCASKVELTAAPGASFATLLTAAARLRPDLLVVDALQPCDAPTLADLLARGVRGIVAAGEPQAMARLPRETADLLVSVGRRGAAFVVASMEDATGGQLFAHHKDGGFRRRTVTPSFAGTVQEAGYGEALSKVLR